MIQIDDAGWGSLVGGVTIGVYRIQTQEFAAETIPPRFFQVPAFADKFYLDQAVAATRRCFQRLHVRHGERIEVCTNYSLSKVRDRLSEAGYNWRPAQIEGPLQKRLTRAFWHHLRDLGFRVDYDEYVDPTRRGLVWWRQVAWLKGGDVEANSPHPERAKFCKIGWGSYEIWSQRPYQMAKQLARKRREERRRARPWL